MQMYANGQIGFQASCMRKDPDMTLAGKKPVPWLFRPHPIFREKKTHTEKPRSAKAYIIYINKNDNNTICLF